MNAPGAGDRLLSDAEASKAVLSIFGGFQPKIVRRIYKLGDPSGVIVDPDDPSLVRMTDENGSVTRVRRGTVNEGAPAGTPYYVGETIGHADTYAQVYDVATAQIGNYSGQTFSTAWVGAKMIGVGDAVSGNLKGSANFTWDDGEVDSYSDTGALFQFWSFGTRGAFTGNHARGTRAAPSATQSGDELMRISAFGYGTTDFTANSVCRFRLFATENFTDTATGAMWQFQTTPKGTNAPTDALFINDDQTTELMAGFRAPITNPALLVDTTLDASYYTVLVDATGGPIAITLPPAVDVLKQVYIVNKIDASANAVTVTADGTENINGANTYALTTQYASVTIQSANITGLEWVITAKV